MCPKPSNVHPWCIPKAKFSSYWFIPSNRVFLILEKYLRVQRSQCNEEPASRVSVYIIHIASICYSSNFSTGYSSAVENYCFGTTEYCTVTELVAVAKRHCTLYEKREVEFHMAHRGQTYRVYKLVRCGSRAVEHSKRYYPTQFQQPPRLATARVDRENSP